jgi:hypothetical protein
VAQVRLIIGIRLKEVIAEQQNKLVLLSLIEVFPIKGE